MRNQELLVGECESSSSCCGSDKMEANKNLTRNLLDAASGGITATAASASGTSMSTGGESDFVWAVRVTKIWKDTLDRTWSFKTQSKGATFSLEDEERRKEEVAQALEAEGTGEAKKLWLGDGDEFLVF